MTLLSPQESALEFLERNLRAVDSSTIAKNWIGASATATRELAAARTIVARGKSELSPLACMGDPILVELVHEFFTVRDRAANLAPGADLAQRKTLSSLADSIRGHLAKCGKPIEPRTLKPADGAR